MIVIGYRSHGEDISAHTDDRQHLSEKIKRRAFAFDKPKEVAEKAFSD